MGAGNYRYRSPIMDGHQTGYQHMIYVDEWEPENDENPYLESILDDVIWLLKQYLTGFQPAVHAEESDVCNRYGHERLLGHIGRLSILVESTCHINRIAILVVPNSDWQHRIYAIESDAKRRWIDSGDCNAAERAQWASAIRTLRSGALNRELAKTYRQILDILDAKGGLAKQMWYYDTPWTSCAYQSANQAA